MNFFLSLLSLAFLSSCFFSKQTKPAIGARYLSKKQSELRASQVSKVHYDLFFRFQKRSSGFEGKTKISFHWAKSPAPLQVDLFKADILELKVNGEKKPADYDESKIIFDPKLFTMGLNTIEISYKADYSKNGSGMYQFIDESDETEYLYTQLQPFDANKVFPCFDQPDIKASYKLVVEAPKSWKVITSSIENKAEQKNDEESPTSVRTFKQTSVFSTYVWALHLGDYHEWTHKHQTPLRLFSRKKLAPFVQAENWFRWTKHGLHYFNQYFDLPYPYEKYDQVIVPDFNFGAMENVAAVTFSENYIQRGAYSRVNQRRIASTILHELAHMWFGNLVTPKWWNDLWLNESFATYMAAEALGKITEFNESWRAFNDRKQRAYQEDSLVTTHGIETAVDNTLEAQTRFNGITYGKGAAVLKQLVYVMGEASFRSSIRNYIKKHAGKNTELNDFFEVLSTPEKSDWRNWHQLWLQRPGVNSISTKFQCENGKISQFSVLQQAPQKHPHLRPHTLEIALLKSVDRKQIVYSRHKVTVSKKTTPLPQLHGEECPEIVYPNYQDQAYFKVFFDKQSLKKIKEEITFVKDPFLRQLFWTAAWNMVLEAQMPLWDYIDMVARDLPYEKEKMVLEKILESVTGRYTMDFSVLFFLDHLDPKFKKPQERFLKNLEVNISNRLRRAPPGSELQKLLYKSFVRVAETPFATSQLEKWLRLEAPMKGLIIDQDKRWGLLRRLAIVESESAEKWLKKEQLNDTSSRGKLRALQVGVAQPDWEAKMKWIDKYLKADGTLTQFRYAFWAMFPRQQDRFRERYSQRFFSDLKKVNQEMDPLMASAFLTLAPSVCSSKTAEQISTFLTENQTLLPGLLKALKEEFQKAQRCKALLALAQSPR